jgi:hypothetical protein
MSVKRKRGGASPRPPRLVGAGAFAKRLRRR